MAVLPAPHERAPYDPDQQPMTCEVCGAAMTRGSSHSIMVCYATTGNEVPIPAFTCEGGEHGNGQHFCCSKACAVAAAHACVEEHLHPLHEAHRQRALGARDAHARSTA